MLYIVTDCDGPGKERGGINGRNIRAMENIFQRLFNAYLSTGCAVGTTNLCRKGQNLS